MRRSDKKKAKRESEARTAWNPKPWFPEKDVTDRLAAMSSVKGLFEGLFESTDHHTEIPKHFHASSGESHQDLRARMAQTARNTFSKGDASFDFLDDIVKPKEEDKPKRKFTIRFVDGRYEILGPDLMDGESVSLVEM